jgi:hypothetical protein
MDEVNSSMIYVRTDLRNFFFHEYLAFHIFVKLFFHILCCLISHFFNPFLSFIMKFVEILEFILLFLCLLKF